MNKCLLASILSLSVLGCGSRHSTVASPESHKAKESAKEESSLVASVPSSDEKRRLECKAYKKDECLLFADTTCKNGYDVLSAKEYQILFMDGWTSTTVSLYYFKFLCK